MRNCPLSMLSCAALFNGLSAGHTNTHENPVTKPKYEINDAAPIHLHRYHAQPVSSATCVSSATRACRNIVIESPVYQNNNQTEIDLAIGTVTKSSETQQIRNRRRPTSHQKMWPGPKPRSNKIIGFATPVLVHNLGRPIWFAKKA